MLVKDDRGFKVWGSIPSCLQLFDIEVSEEIEADHVERIRNNGHDVKHVDGKWILTTQQQRSLDKGDRVRFTATVTPSNDDAKFGFYKRPTKAELVT
jgi:hypothetical protein